VIAVTTTHSMELPEDKYLPEKRYFPLPFTCELKEISAAIAQLGKQ